MSDKRAPEPAFKSYFFDKGYRDLKNTLSESWYRNRASSQQEFAMAGALWSGEYLQKALAVLRFSAGISTLIFGTIFFLTISAVHVAVLALFFLLIYIGFTFVYLLERALLTWKGFFMACPECHSKTPLPHYFCSGCGARHQRLIPSQYGILRHRCECRKLLPATFFLDRSQLQAVCPSCDHLLHSGQIESRKLFVPIFGGPAVGKSAFLFGAVDQLVGDVAPQLGFEVSFPDSRGENELERARQQMARGLPPDKTPDPLPRAFNVQLSRAGDDPRMLYFYDPAGEAFHSSEGLAQHRYQGYPSGLIFLVDPFSIPEVAIRYEEQLSEVEGSLKPSQLAISDALSRILIGLEESFGLGPRQKLRFPVAVVINKIDAFDLEAMLADLAATLPSLPEKTDVAVRGHLLREQLILWNQADFVQQLELRCSELAYFSCSSLGRMPDGSARPFKGVGVLEPVLWILERRDAAFFGESIAKAA